MPASKIAAKTFDIRANDFASSSSVVSLKTYDSSSTYSFYLPSSDPKYIDGVSGQEQVADQVLTYDVVNDVYTWKQSGAASELFIQGQTTEIGSDEHGNVMTLQSESRVAAGDPMYDPLIPGLQTTWDADNVTGETAAEKVTRLGARPEQVFKASYQFTDSLYNLKSLVACKKNGPQTFTKSAGVHFEYATGTTPDTSASVDNQKQEIDQVQIQTSEKADGSVDVASFMLNKDMCKMKYIKSSTTGHSGELTMTSEKLSLKTGGRQAEIETPSICKTVFEGKSSHFTVDNCVKSVDTDMDTIEFGPSSSRHRLAIMGSNLYIQKYDGTKWVGADVKIDENTDYVGTISITAVNDSTDTITITPTLGGTFDHWHYKLDDGTEVMSSSVTAGDPFTLPVTTLGKHKVVAWCADASHSRVSEYATVDLTVTDVA